MVPVHRVWVQFLVGELGSHVLRGGPRDKTETAPLQKEMATHSGILAWEIPGKEEPGGLPSMGSHRVGHD